MAKSETSQRIRITLADGRVLERRPPVPVGELLDSPVATNGLEVLGAMVNNDVYSLSYPLDSDSTVAFFTIADEHGWRMYVR